MNTDSTWVLDLDPFGNGITVRQIAIAAIVVAGIINILVTLANGRPGRRTCGAPRRHEGRCRRPIRGGAGCGIHGSGWIGRDISISIVGGIALVLLLLNFEAVVAWIGTQTSNVIA